MISSKTCFIRVANRILVNKKEARVEMVAKVNLMSRSIRMSKTCLKIKTIIPKPISYRQKLFLR